jgi:hypothetical protein
MKIRTEQVIDVSDWDKFVIKTYGRPYAYQQQEGCQPRGTFRFDVPGSTDDFENDTLSADDDEHEMGVSFAAWLARDPKLPIENQKHPWERDMWWERNFYPNLQMIANDLHAKGLLAAGSYTIDIDW